MKEDEKCSMHASRRQEMHAEFLLENVKGRDHFGNLVIDGWIMLKWVFKKLVMYCIYLTQNSEHWKAPENMIMNFWVP
jgi:hypothetical protein